MPKYDKFRIDAINAYNKEHMVQICVKLNKKKDADIIEHIFSKKSKSGYIKDLVRADLEGKNQTV